MFCQNEAQRILLRQNTSKKAKTKITFTFKLQGREITNIMEKYQDLLSLLFFEKKR